MEQNKWINEVLESTNGMQKAEPSPFLFEKVTARINAGKTNISKTSPAVKWAFAMSTVIIIALNVFVISDYTGNNIATSTDNDLISNLSSELGYNKTYNY